MSFAKLIAAYLLSCGTLVISADLSQPRNLTVFVKKLVQDTCSLLGYRQRSPEFMKAFDPVLQEIKSGSINLNKDLESNYQAGNTLRDALRLDDTKLYYLDTQQVLINQTFRESSRLRPEWEIYETSYQ